jgi:phosphohistidine phosphatase
MHRLILFRHAKTEARAPGGDDIDRALVERGRADAERMGQILADAGIAPDLVLVSPALRARETWALASPAFPPVSVEVRDGLYDATPEEVADELTQGAASADTVMVVGHNPSLHELAITLLEDGGADPVDIERVSAGFPTATAATFRFDDAGRARLESLLHIREQGAGEVRQDRPEARRLTPIFKILSRCEWECALSSGCFEGSTVDRADGFIHFSTADQVVETARRHFAGQMNLVVLTVHAEALGPALRWEPSRGGALFPHLYAALDVTRVVSVQPMDVPRS